ncbi:MAG: hypothetical protein ACFFDH_15305 [Promethearchaeota archaeon]
MNTIEKYGDIIKYFDLFSGGSEGIENLINKESPIEIFDCLQNIEKRPLSKVQLNQLLILSHEKGVSDGFFRYYWLDNPKHPYDVEKLPEFKNEFIGIENYEIKSIQHLKWGIHRIYIDGLLFFGNIKNSYHFLCSKDYDEIASFFKSKIFDTESMQKRGPSLKLNNIARDDRYLISEMACKSFGEIGERTTTSFEKILTEAWLEHEKINPGKKITIKDLLSGNFFKKKYLDISQQTLFSATEILDEDVSSSKEIRNKCNKLARKFREARRKALKNTDLFLSMVDDLDVYVATSMRNREDFREISKFCDKVFNNEILADLNLRYFDPTMSAAEGHENKGLIECLMVRCTKVLIYCSGKGESYGKDAEAAMALSLGKPVIFFCEAEERQKFYNEVHPLTRLIHFDTGVAVGAFVTSNIEDVPKILFDIFKNDLKYQLENRGSGYFRLKEKRTDSVVRVQTNNELLKETFWNYYHKDKFK